MKFRALEADDRVERPLVVIDLGYSKSRSSCGVTWTDRREATNHRFGVAIKKVARGLRELKDKEPVLVIEAPLSWCHNQRGNPAERGEFEKGRPWYCQPGSSVCLGAFRFLQQLAKLLKNDFQEIAIAEAFLSNKPQDGTNHADDAQQILSQFWTKNPAQLNDKCEAISDLIEGVPSVRVFKHGSVE